MNEISVNDLKKMMDEGEDFQLIDVRENNEFASANMGGVLIPMATVPSNVEKFDKNKKVIVHCRSGKRSANVIQYLETQHGFKNLYNLKGGILAWKESYDPGLNVS
ncbi:MAG: rhodanese-like domain-containing protein [Cyclobacteriaceae bacterium]|nr:rhodanese-like domain-containing protein [Cyclobacteriaceae bacterium]